MSIDLDRIETLAKAATPGPWSAYYEAVIGPDGDSVAVCYTAIGALPDPIQDVDIAAYIAEVNPRTVLALVAMARALPEDPWQGCYEDTFCYSCGAYFTSMQSDLEHAPDCRWAIARAAMEGASAPVTRP